MVSEDRAGRIWQVVHAIPEGKVATYGQVADLAGLPRHARLVGRVLGNLPPGSKLPWHRVVNAAGRISVKPSARQKELLEREGVVFVGDRISLAHYRWDPSAPANDA